MIKLEDIYLKNYGPHIFIKNSKGICFNRVESSNLYIFDRKYSAIANICPENRFDFLL